MPRLEFDGPDGHEVHDIKWNLTTGQLRLTLAEARHIQRVADLTVEQVRDRVFTDAAETDPTALTALVQVLWKRDGRVVPFDAIDFDLGSLTVDLLPEEAEFAERMEAEAASGADAEDPTQAATPSGQETPEG